MKTSKRIISIFLAVLMVLTIAPLSSLADTDWAEFFGVTEAEAAADTEVDISSMSVGDTVEFGSYPQTKVTSTSLISKLNSQSGTWVSYGYYIGDEDCNPVQSDYMKYKDVTYNGEKYRAVTFSSYRPIRTTESSCSDSSYQDDNGYTTGNVYWFKYEPLTWKVLDPSTGLVLCTNIIDSQDYYPSTSSRTINGKTVYANNWEYSTIRTWLNDTFYNTAFTSTQKSAIATTTINNDAFSTYYSQYNANATRDKIYLLSDEDMLNTSYGFSSSFDFDIKRRAHASDYAKSQGVCVATSWKDSDGEYTSAYLCRSADGYSTYIRGVYYSGGSSFSWLTYYTDSGIRPALCLNLSNIYNLGEETYSFKNFGDIDSPGGHCFGMSMTSSAYYLGLLDSTTIGAVNGNIYKLNRNIIVKSPICYYQSLQGSIRDKAIVAGGSYDLKGSFNATSDWTSVIKYVKSHKYDDKGQLVLGCVADGLGGHAVNFLRYAVVNGQERIYIYDNNFPNIETYLYKDSSGKIYEKPEATFAEYENGKITKNMAINEIALVSVSKYFDVLNNSKDEVRDYIAHALFAKGGEVNVKNSNKYLMWAGNTRKEYYVYEVPEDTETIKVTPVSENATFTYNENNYSFKTNNSSTYATVKVADSEKDNSVITIHSGKHSYVAKVVAATCVKKGYTQYTCSDCGDTYKDNYTQATGNHTYKTTTTTKATTSKNGSAVTKCSVCGKVKSTTTVYRPKTYTIATKAYTGKALKPSVVIKDANGKTISSKYYTVTYSNNTKIGTGKAKITFKGNYSGTVTKTFKIVPGQVKGLKATPKTSTLKLSWSKVTGAKYYKVEQYNASTKKWTAIKTTTATSYTVSKLTAGTAYKFRVTALDSTKKIAGKASAVLTAYTLCAAPTIKLTSTKSKTATVTITKVTGAKSYTIYKSTDNKKWTKVITTTKTSYNLTGLTAGKKIYVKVIANNADGKASAYSSVKSVTVKK